MSQRSADAEVLRAQKLEHLADLLKQTGFDTLSSLRRITKEDIQELGIQRLGDKRKLLTLFSDGGTAKRVATPRARFAPLLVEPAVPANVASHVVIPFEELQWAQKAIQALQQEIKILIILSGPNASGKTSILLWILEQLSATPKYEITMIYGAHL